MSDSDLPPAGWYPDPLHNQRERYWNGEAWEQDERGSGLVPVGYITAVILPIVGFIIGIVLATRRDDPTTSVHGPYIVLTAIVAAVFWATIVL